MTTTFVPTSEFVSLHDVSAIRRAAGRVTTLVDAGVCLIETDAQGRAIATSINDANPSMTRMIDETRDALVSRLNYGGFHRLVVQNDDGSYQKL